MTDGEVVKIGGKEYHVVDFKWGKSRIAVELLTALLQEAGLGELIGGVGEAQDNVILGKSSSAIGQILLKLPAIVEKSIPLAGRLAALVLTPNETIKAWNREGKVITHMLDQFFAEEIEFEVDAGELFRIVAMATKYLASDPVIKQVVENLPKGVIALGRAYLGMMTQSERILNSQVSSESSTDTPTTTASTT